MLKLRPYKAFDAEHIVKWLHDERSFYEWSADRYGFFPITAQDMNAYYDKDKDNDRIWGMSAIDETGIVGHFILRYPKEHDRELRIGFFIIKDTVRGKGYGKEMMSLAIRYAFEFMKVEKISLGVVEQNMRAIKCYEACGFKQISDAPREICQCMGEEWTFVDMELQRVQDHAVCEDFSRIHKADTTMFQSVKEITIKTIQEIYPNYYPKGAVDYFLAHHKDANIQADLQAGNVYLIYQKDVAIGTVTIKENEICRLFVLPSYQKQGYGRSLISFAENTIFLYSPVCTLDASLPAKAMYRKRGYEEISTHTIETKAHDYLCYDVMQKQRI